MNSEPVWLTAENCHSNNFEKYCTLLLNVAQKHGLIVETLGHIQNKPILLLNGPEQIEYPHILFAGCFHGDEPAGSWGILRFLSSLNEWPKKINISFLPIVNPTGFINGKRRNYLDQDPNRNFYHTESEEFHPSEEGMILLSHIDRIKFLSKDIFVSLHEDWEFEQFYIYSFEASEEPGDFSKILRNAELRFFEPFPDGPLEDAIVKDGMIFNHCDGSFEDLLFHKGSTRTACTETPGKFDLETRINGNSYIIREVVNWAQSTNI